MHEIEQQAVDNPSPWARKNIAEYLASDGEDVEHPSADRMILLYVEGRKTGTIYRTPLVHFPDGDDMLIVASKGGAPDDPQWYRNLVDNPRVWVRFKSDFYEATAETLGPDERPAAWEMITKRSPAFADYQKKAERTIPVVRLRKVASAAA